MAKREADDFSGHINVNNPSNYLWHLEVDVHDVNGNYLFPIIYPSVNGLIQNFDTQTDQQLVVAASSGHQLKYYAVLEAGNQPFYAGIQNIIEKEWNNKNVVLFNQNGKGLAIPIKYFPLSQLKKVRLEFQRLPGSSTYSDFIRTMSSIILNGVPSYFEQVISSPADEYFALNIGGDNNLNNIPAGVFKYTATYYDNSNQSIYSETGNFDLTKIGNINSIYKNANPNFSSPYDPNKVVVLIAGINDNIENAIQSLPTKTGTDLVNAPWSIADSLVEGGYAPSSQNYNTWYIATCNVNSIQKNAYDIGTSLIQ